MASVRSVGPIPGRSAGSGFAKTVATRRKPGRPDNVEDCIFCKIVEGEIDSEKIYETENALSFLDVNPRSPGHSLVIPKEHVRVLEELDDEVISEVFTMVKNVEKAIRSALDPDAFTVGINDGEAAGQEIPHLHVNIMPRFEGDGGRPVHSVVDNPPGEDVSDIAEEIRSVSESK